eukprot:CAMPEP_0181219032 /NCGR_PEP_ID=MMETSP1096-20121128/28030_1 /TAXON_ID=156174 ORGANISM="Chrysochromulina ericina, Strain CCMP281" /NCGR_SAMPLE_ID=MMETSP1096 /ASSEMBLY_ACC=CAM_ASM_000453 /LENGTH=65 /DNA_ID=CAMNT_0023311327 /DNA_START=432 /DNA_END=626 /DNA_ORIENTATION=-
MYIYVQCGKHDAWQSGAVILGWGHRTLQWSSEHILNTQRPIRIAAAMLAPAVKELMNLTALQTLL